MADCPYGTLDRKALKACSRKAECDSFLLVVRVGTDSPTYSFLHLSEPKYAPSCAVGVGVGMGDKQVCVHDLKKKEKK